MKFKFPILLIAVIIYVESAFPALINHDSLLQNYVKQYREIKDVPSIAGGISRDGRILWMGGAGNIDLENPAPVHPAQSVYRLASVSKTLTAIAILQLVEAKKINLDEDIRVYVPYYPKKKWKVTVRQILQHTSGIRTYNDGEFDSKAHFNSIRDVVNYLAQDSLMFEPGTNYLYSSLAYTLLGAAIENVTGMYYTDYMRKNIFERAGMHATQFDFYDEIVKHRARGYVKNNYRENVNAPLADLSIKFPGGGVISTVEDLLIFGNKLLQGELISKAYIDTMTTPIRLKNGQTRSYGLGVALWYDGHKRFMFGHLGGGTGFTTQLYILPKERIVSVHLINLKDRNLDNPALTFIETILGDTIPLVKRSLSDRLFALTLSSGTDAALKQYNVIVADSLKWYDGSDSELLQCGNDLLTVYKHREAIEFFSLYVEKEPQSVEAHIGLGNAYLRDGNKGLALKFFKKVLKLDPKNSYAVKMSKQIE